MTDEQRVVLSIVAGPPTIVGVDAASVDPSRLLDLLQRLRLVTLAGTRLRDAGLRLGAAFEQSVRAATERAAEQGRLQELVLLSLSLELARAGIRSVPLKGPSLARAVHGDVALRVSGDLDLLVDPTELARAVEVVQQMGWRALDPVGPPLPLLHVRLVHDELPPLELHWRIHWYEKRFAVDALARAAASAPGELLRMQAADELAALVLFHARDGLSGLRLPADVGAWAGSGRHTATTFGELAELAAAYPTLRPALCAGAHHLAGLVALSHAPLGPLRARERAACRLANPFLAGPRAQIRADISFVDILLSPRGGTVAAMRRQFDNAPGTESAPRRVPSSRRPPPGHVVRTVGRWSASAARATVAPRPGASVVAPRRNIAGVP